MDSIEHTLETPFEYSYQGEFKKAEFILLKAPTANNSRYTAKLKQGFYQAIRDFQGDAKEQSGDEKNKISGDEMIDAIMMSNSVDFGKYVEDFKSFMCKGIALMNGEEIFKEKLFDNLSENDLMGMMGAYLENFLISL